ncbi:MAG: hypothetical protein QGG39_16580, partial [Candidatus Poribacteria bacterium]|nr:hypothetical protein [Candidatus Poribacteria bacterium]
MFSPRNYDSVSRLSSDIIQPSNELDFNWLIRADEHAFTLSWSLSQVPAHYQSITLTDTLSDQEINMMDQASLVLDKGNYQFQISLRPSRLAEIVIQAGWNMISISGEPLNPDPATMLNKNSQVILPLYQWNPTRFTYESVEEIESGQGYWILSLNPEDEVLQVPVLPITSYQKDMELGWSMIGSVWGEADFSDPQDDPDGSVVGSAFQWNPRRFTYETADVFQNGRGYWVLVPFQKCQLTISAGVAGTPLATAPVAMLPPQINGLTLQVAGQQDSAQVSLGWHNSASPNLDTYDLALPPTSPQPSSLQVHFQVEDQPWKLQRQVQPWSNSSRWQLEINSQDSTTINWNSQSLPPGSTLIATVGQREIDLRQQSELSLSAGQHQLVLKVAADQSGPTTTQVYQNYPNPFNPETWIPFQLKEAAQVMVRIYDLRGQPIRHLDLGHLKAGRYLAR